MVVRIRKPRAILVDLEGTSSPKSFFKGTLLPYVKSKMEKYLDREWQTPEIITAIKDLRADSRTRLETDRDSPEVASRGEDPDTILRSVVRYMNYSLNDSYFSDTILLIIFHLWVYGYERKELKSDIFEDVADGFKEWKQKRIKIYSISSGREEAQMMMYARTTVGPLHHLIDGYFDGNKQERSTYREIAKQIKESCDDILFLTDDYREARAAAKSEAAVVMVSRPGNLPIPPEITNQEEFSIIKAFDDIRFK